VTVPSFLNTGFAFAQLPAATDVQNIMDAVNTMLTSTLSATPTGVYPSGERWAAASFVFTAPSDIGGRFMKVTLSRIAQNRMQFQMEDPGGVIFDGEIDINIAGTLVNIFGGPGHLYIEVDNAGTPEMAHAVMVDPTPEPMSVSTVYVYGRVARNSSGTIVSSYNQADDWLERFRNGSVTGVTFYQSGARPTVPAQDTSNTHLRTQAGSDVVAPMYMGSDISFFGGQWLNGYKIYQAIVVDINNAPGTILNVPIDIGITGQFQIVNVSNGSVALAIRRG